MPVRAMLAGAAIITVISKGTSNGVPLALNPSEPDVPELSLEETLSRVRGHTLKLFKGHELLDDLLQEAAISAWKDYQDGESMGRIIMRSKYRVLGLISEKSTQYRKWTGTLPGARNHEYEEKEGAESRKKIREYLSSYTKLHGHKPSVPEIAKHMGMSRQSIYRHLDRLWLFSGNTEFQLVSADTHPKYWDGESDETVANRVTFGSSFEDDLIDRIDTLRWVREQTDERERTFLYYKIFKQLTNQEIGTLWGVHKNTVDNITRKALTRMREALNDQTHR